MISVKTVNFYRHASEQQIEAFEDALDIDDTKRAHEIIENFQASDKLSFEIEGKIKAPEYLESPPEVGDMVVQTSTGHMVRLIAISDDKELALVKEEWGAHPAQYADLRRVR